MWTWQVRAVGQSLLWQWLVWWLVLFRLRPCLAGRLCLRQLFLLRRQVLLLVVHLRELQPLLLRMRMIAMRKILDVRVGFQWRCLVRVGL